MAKPKQIEDRKAYYLTCALIGIAGLSIVFAIVHLVYGLAFLQASYNKDVADDVVLYLALAVVVVVFLKTGRLYKLSFGGSTWEFQQVVEKINRDSAEVKNLGAELAGLRAAATGQAESQAGGKEPMPELPPAKATNDRQKGRFGGRAALDGYALSVQFHSPHNAKIVNLDLVVKRTDGAKLEQNVHFFLHQTFKPEEVVVVPKDNEARLDILCVGGFTVGAWIEGTKTLLELDLSEVPKAPRVIREE